MPLLEIKPNGVQIWGSLDEESTPEELEYLEGQYFTPIEVAEIPIREATVYRVDLYINRTRDTSWLYKVRDEDSETAFKMACKHARVMKKNLHLHSKNGDYFKVVPYRYKVIPLSEPQPSVLQHLTEKELVGVG